MLRLERRWQGRKDEAYYAELQEWWDERRAAMTPEEVAADRAEISKLINEKMRQRRETPRAKVTRVVTWPPQPRERRKGGDENSNG